MVRATLRNGCSVWRQPFSLMIPPHLLGPRTPHKQGWVEIQAKRWGWHLVLPRADLVHQPDELPRLRVGQDCGKIVLR